MTGKLVSRVLMIAGLAVASATVGFAQNAPAVAKLRRVGPAMENQQPVAASTVIMSSQNSLGLSADQRAKISSLNSEVSALHSERAKLWAEYRAITSASNYNDRIAESQAAPRMRRIVAINEQLSGLVARQDQQVASILSPAQRASVAKLVTTVKAGL